MHKEERIAGQLRGALARHRVIIHPDVIEYDSQTIQQYPAQQRDSYSLINQLGKMTLERGSLLHDDRLDAVAGAIGAYEELLELDSKTRMEQKRVDENIAFFKEWGGDIGGNDGQLGNIKDRFRRYR